ncbi:MAG: CpsB/CapC family capsule biosynthesis tyrosine phosphatase [Psychromonas sp.]
MIDLHSHILANIDDGVLTLEDSIVLIRGALANGVTKILATPHIHLGTFDNNITIIHAAFDALIQKLQEQDINISLAYAAEVRICPEIISLSKNKKLPFMGKWQGSDLLLLEFPHSHIPPGSEKLIDWLISQNIKPMIAHPERNRDLWQFSELLKPFKQRGCLFQVTASSLLGDFGPRSEHLAWQLLENNEVTIIASDMHNISRRPCKMLEAYNAVKSRCSEKMAEQLFVSNPEMIFDSNPTRWTSI